MEHALPGVRVALPFACLLCTARLSWGQDGTCTADGTGCVTLPVYPDCQYSCNERKYIGPDSGNRERIWIDCPHGPSGCRDCDDRHPNCPQFVEAYSGYGCEDNPAFMIDVCAKSCNTCHLRDFKMRCKPLADEPQSVPPGAINETMARLLSIPELKAEILSRDPWILKFPGFLTDEEIEWLRSAQIRERDWQEASDSGPVDAHGRSTRTFSSQRSTGVAWCGGACHNHPISVALRSRIGEMVRVHPHYFESMQFLRYKKGQYYKPHNDMTRTQGGGSSVAKHRVYTFFLYLNDVEGGGATHFPQLGLRVAPERGTAILWPSVKNEDPFEPDWRTQHEAEVVTAGMKYSVNAWIWMGPYRLSHELSCASSPIDS